MLKDLTSIYNTRKERKVLSDRGELLEYFLSRLLDKKGKPYRPAFLNMKLAHCSVYDLQFLKARCLESETRGITSFTHEFWRSIKPYNKTKDLSTGGSSKCA